MDLRIMNSFIKKQEMVKNSINSNRTGESLMKQGFT